MRRPFAVIGFSYLAALAVALYIGEFFYLAAAAFVACVLTLVIGKLRKTKFVPVICITSLIAIICAGFYTYLKIVPSQKILGKTASISARLCDLPYQKYDRYYYKLDADVLTVENGDKIKNTKILLSSDEPIDAELYDMVELKAAIGSAQSSYNIAKGIMLNGYIKEDSVTVIREEYKPLNYYFLMARELISERVKVIFPEENAGLITAMITGDKTSLSTEINKSLRESGISHIVAVSGFHISVTSAFIFSVLMLITRRRRRLASVLSMLFVLSYMAIAGFTPSVTRAGIMQLLLLMSNIFQRPADSMNSLGIAVLIITMLNPYAVTDVGFLLSFSATLGIISLGVRTEKYLKRMIKPKTLPTTYFKMQLKKAVFVFLKGIIPVFSTSFSAFLFTMPVMILYFRQIAIYSVFTNMLIAPVLSVLIVCVIITLLFGMTGVLSLLMGPFVFVILIFTRYIIFTARFVSGMPFALLNVSREFVPIWLIVSVAAAVILYFIKANIRAIRIYSLAVSLTFIFMSIFNGITDMTVVRLSLIDTGNGISLVLVRNGSAYVLSCGGDSNGYGAVSNYLEALNIDKISYLLLTDSKNKTSMYANELLTNFGAANVEVYNEEKYYDNVQILIDQSDNVIKRFSKADYYNTTHIGSLEISSNTYKGRSFVYADIDGFRVLVCKDGTDCALLPKKFTSCDILIVNGTIKNNSAIIRNNVFIADSVANIGKYKWFENDNTYSTDSGSVSVKIVGDHYSIRRESVWLS